MKDKRHLLKHVGTIFFFLIITLIFFLPQFQGKELIQGDQTKWKGMAQETITYHEATGENVAWCGSMFSGMPGYTVCLRTNYINAFNYIEAPFRIFGNRTTAIMLISLICGYILFITFGCPIHIAILGAVGFALSSYFPIIIEAGHVTKGWVMATMPLVIASLMLIMKRKWILGGLLFTFSLTENLRHEHIQITYYLMLLCLFIFIGYSISKIIEKKYQELLKSTGVMFIGVIISLLLCSNILYSNYEMSKTSTRGPSELTSAVDGKQDKSSGLDMDYAFAWSYGKAETLTFLIPNLYGGATGSKLGANSHLSQAYKKNQQQVPNQLRAYTYWGDQPFTSGPVYFGAIICFLFVLSLFIINRKYKWWVVAATLFLIVMSWGKNLPSINEFLFHHLPLYNKFRTPSMALVIPQLTFVWFACLALKDICEGKIEIKKLKKSLLYSFGITGVLCLIVVIMPTLFFDFSSASDSQLNAPDWYINALTKDRIEMAKSDAWRSFLFIAVTFIIIYITSINIKKESALRYGIIAIATLTFFDLWSVDRRYLNEDNFVKKTKKTEFALTTADKFILEDKSPSYRVLTFNNPFNDTNVSYYHKSIGGYNAAKLRRYQDLIDLQIEPEMRLISNNISNANIRTIQDADSILSSTPTPILDMLNMRYLILNSDFPAATNHSANGNAWFIKKIKFVENADNEMMSLKTINPKETAIVDKTFSNVINEGILKTDSSATIKMTSYEPICVKYESDSKTESVALFSEVYYQPRWKAYIDGNEANIFRANWILRGLKIPAGKHEIIFKDEPNTYWNLTLIGCIGSFILVGLTIALCVLQLRKRTRVTN